MKLKNLKYGLTSVLMLSLLFQSMAQNGGNTVVSNTAFHEGEFLKFRIHYGVLNAGVATLKLSSSKRDGQDLFHAVGKGWTTGAPKMFFKVDDTYESFFTKGSIKPVFFKRRVDEGGYLIRRDKYFDHQNQTVTVDDLQKNTKKVYPIKDVQDMISSFYFMRNVDITNMKPGENIALNIFFDGETFPFKLKFIKRDVIRTQYGKINTWRVQPMVQKGRVFEDEESLTIWISDDQYKVPVRIKAQLVVGSLKADLDGFNGLPDFKSKFYE